MSFRQDNNLHFRTPYLLLRIPEYMRWFDSAAIGSLYRLLSSKIYRKGVSQLKFYKEGLSLTELAKRYDSGKLCCFVTDEEIKDAMLLQDRRVVDLKKALQDLKLIKYEKFKDGYIYELGVVYKHVDAEGYQTGQESEGHYIDQWYTWANCDENSEQMIAFKYYLAENLGSDKKKEEVQQNLCKILQDIPQNFAKILGLVNPAKHPPVREKSPVKKSPIEVNNNRTYNYVSTSVDEPILGNNEILDAKLSEFKARLRYGRYPISNISQEYRDIISQGIKKDVVDEAIMSSVPENCRYKDLPLFSKNLTINHKNAVDGFSWKWFAMREDITGAVPPKDPRTSMYKEVKVAFKNVVEKYSVEQIEWTIREIAKNTKARLALVNNCFAISKMIADYSVSYTKFVQDNHVSELKSEAQTANSNVSDEERAEFLRKAAQEASYVAEPKEEGDKNSVEYWKAKLVDGLHPMLRDNYLRNIAKIERSGTL